MKNLEFEPFEPRTIEEAVGNMQQQITLYHFYKQGVIESCPDSIKICKKFYSQSRELTIKLGGLDAVKQFPNELK